MGDGKRRNEPCWCGSGRKYKKCHRTRADEPKLPFPAIISHARDAGAYRTCLHPAASQGTCGRIVSAHTLQRARVLKRIASGDGHVLTFHASQLTEDGRLTLHRRGWNQASTFEAFCDRHDSATFAPLETQPYQPTAEQLFLIAYRAMCWELYQKARVVKSGSTLRDLIDRGSSEPAQRSIQELLAVRAAGVAKGLADLSDGKAEMDAALAGSNYSAYMAREFQLEGPVSVVSTGGVTPNRGLGGAELQTLHDAMVPTQWLSFGIDVNETLTSVVFVWRKQDDAPSRYVAEVAALDGDALAEFLSQFFFAHCENTYFSECWWQALKEGDRLFYESLMANSNPYYDFPEYQLDRGTVSWHLVSQRAIDLGRRDS